jgi:hypothetical protein
MRTGAIAAALIASLGAAIALAGGAPLSGAITVVRAPTTLNNDGAPVTVTAKCPVGRFTTGGGFRFNPGEDLPGVAAPVKAGRFRVTALRSELEPEPSVLTAFALCAKGPIERVETTEDLPALAESREAKARCPRGSVVVGGGGAIGELTTDSMLEGSYPGGTKTWIATAYRGEEGFDDTSLTATALCAEGREVVIERESAPLPPDQVPHRVIVTCPPRTKRVSGGARVDPDEDFLAGSFPTGERGWAAFGYRDASQLGASRVTAFVVCLKRG